MYHGLNNEFLYTAHKMVVTFADSIGNNKTIIGTCFFVQNSSGEMCLITNRHMLDIEYKDPTCKNYSIVNIDISGKSKKDNCIDTLEDINFKIILITPVYSRHPKNDVACLKNIKAESLDGRSTIAIDHYLPYDFLATNIDFSKNLHVCDFLAFPGFPAWHDKRSSRPILRTGTISSDPRFDYSYTGNDDGACVAYEAFSYGGSSGSPVFAVQKGPKPGNGIIFPGFRRLCCVGINAGHLPINYRSDETSPDAPNIKLHSGISYFYKSSIILDLIDHEVALTKSM
jgi:hypothetical protein